MSLALLVLLLAAEPAGSPPPADLMKKLADATATMQKSADAADVTIDTLAEQLDKTGKATDTTDVVLRITHVDGHEHDELVKYVENGKDVTEEKKAKAAKDDAKKKKDDDKDGDANEDVPIPFSAKRQPRYRFVAEGSDDQGRLRIHYEPSGAPTSDDGIGDAVVDPATGALVEMTWTPAKLPTMVKELAMTLTFTQDPTHGAMLSKIEGHGRAGILFVQKRFRLTTTFGDYAFPPAPAPTP